ncbi:prepilin-type N-terminal cleavage/methylation domain-containing protein [bacterium]|nr:prepilin-type N-terminal cleavage/methylation domain-containing protein [bacterium]
MNIKRIDLKNLKKGFSLLEVLVSCFLLVIAIVPIYRSLTSTAAQEIDTTKLSMARKILESLRQEVGSVPFKELKALFPGGTTFQEMSGGFPGTLQQVLDNQKKFKDFNLKVQLRFTNSSETVIECKGTVTWTANDNKIKSEEITFLQVKP